VKLAASIGRVRPLELILIGGLHAWPALFLVCPIHHEESVSFSCEYSTSGGGGSVASDDFKGVVDSMRSKLYYV